MTELTELINQYIPQIFIGGTMIGLASACVYYSLKEMFRKDDEDSIPEEHRKSVGKVLEVFERQHPKETISYRMKI
ncbi:hypothetical protein HYX16_00105 [Candidatus Woesearchaeota archaeon]|nr:hypothetical protein [Candidatus Woesearchaeota archaeon]